MVWVTVAESVIMVMGQFKWPKIKSRNPTPQNGCVFVNLITEVIEERAPITMKHAVKAHGPVFYRNKVWSFGGAGDREACVYSCREDRWDSLPPFEQDHGGSYAFKMDNIFWLYGKDLDDIHTFDPETYTYGKLNIKGLRLGV